MAEPDAPAPRSRPRVAAATWMGKPVRARPNTRVDGAKPSPRITVRRAVRLAGAGVIGVVVALGAVWLAILYMPLPASQVVPRVQAALQSRLGPAYAVTIADAELHRGGDGVELRLVDLAVAKVGGPVVAEAPRVELRVDGLSLLTGEVKVRSVHVTNPRLDMQFDTTVGAATAQSDLPRRILAAAADLDRLLGPDGAAGALEVVEVDGATVLVAPRSRAPLSLNGVDLKLSRAGGGALALTASSARAGERWTTAVTVTPAPDGKGRVVDLGLENVDLAPYSAPLAEKAGAPPLKGRLSGHLNARIGPDGELEAGGGRIAARDIQITLPGPQPAPGAPISAVEFETLQLNLGWDAANRSLLIEPSRISGRGGQMSFSGAIAAPTDANTKWMAALEGRDVLLAAESGGEAPLRLDRVIVNAAFDLAAGVLEVNKAQFLGPTAKAAATGLIRFEGASPAIRLGLVSEPMPASAMKRLWPFFMAKEARAWALENVSAGTVDSLSLSLDIASGVLATLAPKEALPDGSLSLQVLFSNAVLRGRPGLPWVEGGGGRIDVTAHTTVGTMDRGFVAQGSGDALTVSGVRFDVPDMGNPRQPASVTFRAEGAVGPALALLASGSVGPNPLPPQLDVSKVTGKISADVRVGFDLDHDIGGSTPPPDVRVTADITDVTVANLFAGKSFEKGAVKVVADGGKTDVSGKGRIGGAGVTMTMVETPETQTSPRKRELKALLTADAGDLTRLGFDVPGALKGELPIEASLSLDAPGGPIALSADLKAVGIDGVVPGFRKPAGQAGRLSFSVDKSADRTSIKNFSLESGDRSVRGTIEFGPKGELLSATLPIYRPAPGDDARVEIDKTRSGSVKVVVQGAALDLKPLLDAFRGKTTAARGSAAGMAGNAPAMPKNLDVTAKLGTGLGYGGEAIAGLDIKITMRDGKVTDADGSGRLGRGVVKLATAEDGRLKLSGEDAGAFFRLADFYGRIDGGVFDLSASLIGGPGLLRVKDFSVRNDDALVRVQQTTGANKSAVARSGSTRFDRLRVAFVEGGGKINIQEASLTGPQLGATLDGVVDYAADKVSLVGTFVPAYALNNLVSRVPIIGALLGGGENGGLIGVTFQVKGKTASPTVTINPVSAVAPGFLRKIFEFRQSGTDATSSAPAPAPSPTVR